MRPRHDGGIRKTRTAHPETDWVGQPWCGMDGPAVGPSKATLTTLRAPSNSRRRPPGYGAPGDPWRMRADWLFLGGRAGRFAFRRVRRDRHLRGPARRALAESGRSHARLRASDATQHAGLRVPRTLWISPTRRGFRRRMVMYHTRSTSARLAGRLALRGLLAVIRLSHTFVVHGRTASGSGSRRVAPQTVAHAG